MAVLRVDRFMGRDLRMVFVGDSGWAMRFRRSRIVALGAPVFKSLGQ
jgi:hypothetical protein